MNLQLTYSQLQNIAEQARSHQPNECCGVLFGHGHTVKTVHHIPNSAEQPTQAFTLNPIDFLIALKNAEKNGQELVGIYHSHPTTAPQPSIQDIQEAQLNTPDLPHLIVSLRRQKAEFQAWRITPDTVERVEIIVGNHAPKQFIPFTSSQKIAILIAVVVAVILLIMVSFALLPPAPPLPIPSG